MEETPLLSVIPEKCTLCYNCIRVCPVKAIEVKVEEDTANIIPSRCVGCGSCFTDCPHDAIVYRDSKEEVKHILKEDGIKVAILDPSVSGEFDDISDYRKFIRMLKALGITYVNGSSFGVDLVANKYKELYDKSRGKYYLSTTCPVVVSTVEKFHPDLIDNLAPIVSPMIAKAQVVRKRYGKDVKIIYIGPCIASKDEAKRFQDTVKIDSVLTFLEIRELFYEHEIKEMSLEFSKFNRPHGYKGTLYPLSNGLLKAGNISEDPLTGEVITVEGSKNFNEAIKQFEKESSEISKHINLFYCEGCLMGPGTSKGKEKYKRQTQLVEYTKQVLKTVNRSEWENYIREFKDIEYEAKFNKDDQRITKFKKEEVSEVLKTLAQNNEFSHNCGACGYDTCKEFAQAVSKGLAKVDMCINYTLSNRQDTIRELRSTNQELEETNRELEKTKAALKESEEDSRIKKAAVEEAAGITMAVLQKLPSAVVILDENLKVMQSNEQFIHLMGEDAEEINEIIPGLIGADFKSLTHSNVYNLVSYVQKTGEEIVNRDIHYDDKVLNITVFPVKQGKIVGAVLRNLFQHDIRPEEVIKRVTEAIEKNLKMVQNIGFLLGEGASEIEQMLNSIIETYKNNE